jgi:zinc transport system substrate-binding protein
MPFEDRLVEHIAGGPAQFTVVDTAAGITHRELSCDCEEAHCPGGHDHDEHEECPHPGPFPLVGYDRMGEGEYNDPHVWLSPPLLKTMAANVAAALCRADPRHEPAYQANLKRLDAEIDALDHRIARSLAPYRGQAFYVFHPAFGYFADAYGLRQESVEVEGKPPTPRQIFGLIEKARHDHVKIIFLQPQFNQQIAASIAQAIGGAVMPMDDLATDVLANLDDVAEKIAASNREKME